MGPSPRSRAISTKTDPTLRGRKALYLRRTGAVEEMAENGASTTRRGGLRRLRRSQSLTVFFPLGSIP